MFVGREVSSTGTPHLQGYFVLRGNASRLAAMTAMLPGCHLEPRRGTEAQAIEYTKKEGNPDRCDWDDRHQGARTDLAGMAALVKANPHGAARAVAQQMPEMYLKFHGGVRALASALLEPTPLFVQRNVRWYYGPTGTGKSYTAVTEAREIAGSDDDVFIWSTCNFKFASDYAGQTCVVIDELRTDWEHYSYGALLTLLGRNRHSVELKGTQVPWRAVNIWVTCPMHPTNFEVVGDPIQQLLKRISLIRHFDVPYVPPPPPLPSDAHPPAAPATQPMSYDSDSEDVLPGFPSALVVRAGARAPLPVCDMTCCDSEGDVIGEMMEEDRLVHGDY